MTNNDVKLFTNVCNLLKAEGINFWICHGTLLGLIREQRLLPWDHDLDFAVWASEVSKEEIVAIFEEAGYIEEKVFGDMNCVHFFGDGKKVDISLYTVDQGNASIKWVAPPRHFMSKIFIFCVEAIWHDSYESISIPEFGVKRYILLMVLIVLRGFKKCLPSCLLTRLYQRSTNYMNYTGYTYPMDLMVFKQMEFSGVSFQVPNNPELCLELTYGPGWKVPQKDYIWYQEAKNLF